MKKFAYFIANGLFLLLLYYGVIREIDIFKDLAFYFAWGTSFIGIVAASFISSKKQLMVKEYLSHQEIIDYRLDALLGIFIVAVFLIYGYYLTAIFYLLYVLMFTNIAFKAIYYLEMGKSDPPIDKKMRFF